MAVRWYLAYSLSYRDIEELLLERGLKIDHSTINRWVLEYSKQLAHKPNHLMLENSSCSKS
jgi:putative transposase